MFWTIIIWVIALPIALTHLMWAFPTILFVLISLKFMVLLSPAAYTFFASMISMFTFPLKWATQSQEVMSQTGDAAFKARVLIKGVLLLVGMLIFLHIVAWACFPILHDSNGAERVRFIPLVPWPSEPFWPVR